MASKAMLENAKVFKEDTTCKPIAVEIIRESLEQAAMHIQAAKKANSGDESCCPGGS